MNIRRVINMVTKIVVVLAFAFLVSSVYMSPVDDKKPFDCPPNEIYYKCDLLVCFKKCDHLVNMPPCPSIAPGCYRPACECIDGYLRNEDGTCIPTDECPKA
ncbi:chymotrypsin/elastase isoinhibitor 1-like [Maniola jurtina]|uniref:chymotrypsin/elastase isoinhibitor 1-like n=1 Tax=Maniola jurtina TaxID=191418 RepID=UPI001E686C81|nr:chymotrypsin/elastase isoinhibitor 1-like [Maniola jurtina]